MDLTVEMELVMLLMVKHAQLVQQIVDLVATCDLTQAYWSVSSTLSGQVVSLIVKGTNCNGKTIMFKVWNDKTSSSDLYVTDTAIDVMESGIATSAWVAVAPYDGDSTPEYYFIAKVFEVHLKALNQEIYW